MNLDLNKIPAQLNKLKDIVKSYIGFFLVLAILVSYGFLIWQIKVFVTENPSETKVAEQLKTINIPKVDEEAIQRISELEDNSVQVKALFEEARQNPFTE